MRAFHLSIRAKLVVGLAGSALLLLTVGALGLRGQARSNADAREIFERGLEPVLQVATVRGAEFGDFGTLSALLLARDPAAAAQAARDVARRQSRIEQAWSAYYPAHVHDGEEREVADAVLADRRQLDGLARTILAQAGEGDFAGAIRTHVDRYAPAYARLRAGTDRLFAINEAKARQAFDASQASFAATRLELGTGIAAGLALVVLLLLAMLRAIATPVRQAASLADAIAGGELNHRIDIRRMDEVGLLLRALQRMDGQLTGIVREVRRSAESVAGGSRDIAHGNDDLSQRTQEQAASLEEVASSMEQITATVRQNAHNAEQASRLSLGTLSSAEESGRIAEQATLAMDEASTASRRIGDIISLIDEISFQTNLLALNAAVEAARAGEHGLGFAVVADAVRTLSQRSASAAREIKQLIGESAAKMDAGVALVGASGHALADVLERVRQVNGLVKEIAAASDEQSGGIGQVSLAVGQLDEVTQQNAALVEQAAAASQALQAQASGLLGQVAFFRIRGEGSEQAVAPAPAMFVAPPDEPVRPPVAARRAAARLVPASAARRSAIEGGWIEF